MNGYQGSTTPPELRDFWRTPEYIIKWAELLIGGIDHDTACTHENAVATPVWNMTSRPDALADECVWSGRCWCNPPYSDIAPWIEKAIRSDAVTAMLIPTPNGESYFHDLIKHSHEISIVGRLAFLGADGQPKKGNNRGSSLFIINGYGQGSRSYIRRDVLISKYGNGAGM